MIGSGGVRVVFGVGAVRDDKYLYILVQPAACPETVSLVSVYLVKRFSQLDSTAVLTFLTCSCFPSVKYCVFP